MTLMHALMIVKLGANLYIRIQVRMTLMHALMIVKLGAI
jgi:hypothetical protein